MKVVAAGAVFALCFTATACPSSPPPKAVLVVKAEDVIPLIKAAHLTKPVAFDGGKLRLDPIQGVPTLSEESALHQWALNAGVPGGVVVVYARATVRIPVTPDSTVEVTPRVMPRFKSRAAWAIFSYSGGPVSCPTAGLGFRQKQDLIPPGTPQSQSVDLIAADGSKEAVVYNSGGVTGVCTRSVSTPNAHPSWYIYSAPWRLAASGNPHETVVVSVPSCSRLWVIDGPANPQGIWTYGFLMKKLTVKPPCPSDKSTLTIDYVRVRGPFGRPALEGVQHRPTGPTSYTFVPPKIKYFDGASREFKTG